jgi:hypothetical protein
MSRGERVLVVCHAGVALGPAVAVALVRRVHPSWSLPRALFFVRARWLPTYPSIPLLLALLTDGDAPGLRRHLVALHAAGEGTAAALDADMSLSVRAVGVVGDEGLR